MSDDTYIEDEEENEKRREDDAVERSESKGLEVRGVNGEAVRVHVISWSNNTFWRIAVFVAFVASLFSIYDNGQRVDRLEGQVCESLLVSRQNAVTLDYYKTHRQEQAEAIVRLDNDLKRFHCPDPDSPLGDAIGQHVATVQDGIVGIGRVAWPRVAR
jgi:hypothetical protein